jgi:hypothetical protein
MAENGCVVVGVLAAHDDKHLAEALAEDLPATLRERGGEHTEWSATVEEVDPADASATPSELVDAVRRRVVDNGWGLGLGLTALPLLERRRPVASHASASHGVGLVSIPALGTLHRRTRLRDASADVVEGLLGEGRGDGERRGRAERMAARSADLASAAAGADPEHQGRVRFAGHVMRGNLRLLLGMIAANHPTRVIARLSRSATAALGTGAYAVSSASLWSVANQSSWPRLLAVGLMSVLLILFAVVIAHGLWERAPTPAAREQVALFNVVTITTLGIGVATLYAALFVLMTLAAVVVIPPESFGKEIGHAAGMLDYAQLGWFAASVATVGGAFGSLLESDDAVRAAIYRRSTADAD